MAILNQTNDGLFHILIILTRCLVSLGPTRKEKLLAVCASGSLTDQKMAKQTLRRWTQIGFFTEDDEVVRLSEDQPVKLTKRNLTNDGIAEGVRHFMYLPKNNERFWDAENNMSADMCRITCWILAQDIHELRPTSFQEPEALYLDQLGTGDRIFQNDTRWNGFKSWCSFLGFGASESGKSRGELIVDPTRAIQSTVIDLLTTTNEIPISGFLRELADEVPVLDGGIYRKEVESKLKSEKWIKPSEHEVSTSLSRALLRLEAKGLFRFEKRSDSDAQVRLLGRGGKAVRNVTHVRRGGVK